jgi:ribosomal protein L37AE/L43A
MDERLKAWMVLEAKDRMSEVGTEPPCPFCQRPRVKRSDYVRCTYCGLNWLRDQNLSRNPNLNIRDIARLEKGTDSGALPAASTSEGEQND